MRDVELVKDGETPSVIKGEHTSCRDCWFAYWDGCSQVECDMDRLRKWREIDPSIVHPCYDENNTEFFVINGRTCNAKRPLEWGKGKSLEQAKAEVRKEIELKVGLFIYIGEGHDFFDVELSAASLLGMSVLPHQVFFVFNTDSVRMSEVHASLFKLLGNTVTWRISNVFKEEGGGRKERKAALDTVIAHTDASYYSVFNAGKHIPADFIREMDSFCNDKLGRFLALRPNKDLQGLTVRTSLHTSREMHGNGLVITEDGQHLHDILEKIEWLAQRDDIKDAVLPVEEVCPCMR